MAVFLNISEYLLGISGAVALAYFIWGGYQMVLSGGRSDMVQSGKDTLVRATIGIAIIFLSGVLVRFTQQALIGRSNNLCTAAQAASGACVPAVGDSCVVGTGTKSSLWISIPAGYSEPSDPAGSFIKENVMCIPADDCATLNTELTKRNRKEAAAGGYTCTDVSNPNVLSCVRGLCGSKGASFACCLCNDGHGGMNKCGS